MKTHAMKLITIITESALEHSIVEDIDKLSGRGYTITNAKGKGHRGVRDASWASDSNIRVEVVCTAENIDKIAEYMYKTYYQDYAMMLYISDVLVIREKKFG